jgi:hypothetical protein
MARIEMYDSLASVNLTGSRLFTGEGDIANVPGALDALRGDAATLTAAMMYEYSGQ